MRNDCRGCGSTALRSVLDFGPMPLAGGFLKSQNEVTVEKLYPLEIHACEKCGLLQILDAVESNVLFEEYSFSSSTIKPLINHFEGYASWLVDRFGPGKFVEFGCNDGVLMLPLQNLGARVIGIDISRNITELARQRGLNVMTGHFDPRAVKEILGRFGRADVVTGSNAFPHNDRPEEILEAARTVLTENGHICLEVMYAGDLFEQLQWDTLYHEHLTFYSLRTLELLLRRYGFHLKHAERLPMHGGSLRVCASLTPGPLDSGAELILRAEEQSGLNRIESWLEFADRCRRRITVVEDVFRSLSARGSVWAYGAAGKATMWLNACKMGYLGAVVDASPFRAGKRMPGIHTQIVLPEQFRRTPPDHMLVTAWNYLDAIRAKEGWFQGIWSAPLPELRFY